MSMNDEELLNATRQAEADAIEFNGTLIQDNERLQNGYLGNPYGDEVPGQSQVVSRDIQDVVEADMPSLARVFLGSGNVAQFLPNSDKDEDIQEAEEKTKYVNWLINEQTYSFKTQMTWLKEAEIQKFSVIKYFSEEVETVDEEFAEGLSALEVDAMQKSFEGENVLKVEIDEQDEKAGEGIFNIKFKVTRKTQVIKYIGVPTENFLITRNSESIEEAELVGDIDIMTRGQLLAEGYSKELISKLQIVDANQARRSNLNNIRFQAEGGQTIVGIDDWASERVEVLDLILKIDYDQDGIAERRRIRKSGEHILDNEVFDHVNYALISTVSMPHQAIGRSRAELVENTQRVKTVVKRQVLNNLYLVNNGRHIVHGDVNLDDMLTVRGGGIVRLSSKSQILPQNAVMPLVTEYIGDKALQIIQYLDAERAQSTGTNNANQGLSVNNLKDESVARFEGIQDQGKAKIELVAREIAENGYRKLYEGMAWTAAKFQNDEIEIMVLGKPLTVNPGNWKFNHQVKVNVGLGAGDNEQLTQVLGSILMLQEQLMARGSLLVDEKDIYNTLDRMIKGSGLHRTDEFFNDPEQPDELLLAQNKQLMDAVDQLQAQLEMSGGDLAKATSIEAQKDLLVEENKGEQAMIKLVDSRDKWQSELDHKIRKDASDAALKATELELDSGQDVPGSVV